MQEDQCKIKGSKEKSTQKMTEYCECKESGIDFNGSCRKCNKKIRFLVDRSNALIKMGEFREKHGNKALERELRRIGGF